MGFCIESSEDFLMHIYIFQILSITFIPGSEVYPNTSIMKKKDLTTLVIIYPQHTSNHATTHIFFIQTNKIKLEFDISYQATKHF